MQADGSGQTNVSHNPAMEDGQSRLTWSPDGSSIIYGSRGRPPARTDPPFRQKLGIAAVLLQSALLVGFALLALRHDCLPFGALTLVFGLNAALMSVLDNQYRLIPGALVAGLAADLLVWRLRPSPQRPGALRLFAFAVPFLFYGLHFFTLQLTGGVGWSLLLWTGSMVLAGAVGLLLSCRH